LAYEKRGIGRRDCKSTEQKMWNGESKRQANGATVRISNLQLHGLHQPKRKEEQNGEGQLKKESWLIKI